MLALTPLQRREVFQLLFLRELARTVPPSTFVLKGGSNLRFFFGSIRYSEDMDIDSSGLPVHTLREKVMSILSSPRFSDSLRTFGIERLRLPNMDRAKQTETVQRFKIGLLAPGGVDLATKLEFSRRGMDEGIRVETVAADVLSAYRLPPIVAPHYASRTAALQKIRALASRALPQARDIFDLYLLSSQPDILEAEVGSGFPKEAVRRARERIYSIGYAQYRDTVVDFLGEEDRQAYDSTQMWDEIRLRVLATIGE